MNFRKKTAIISILIVTILMLGGCEDKSKPFLGDWAYVHDTGTTILTLESNGKAEYLNKTYDYTSDDTFLYLKSSDEDLKMRYYLDGEKLYIYQTTQYSYAGEGTPDGITGLWENAENKWSFEFTGEGTFKEDGYFPGYYTEDKEAGTVKLIYNDHFEDTVFYYTIDGNTLTVEYPWETVPTQKVKDKK